MRNLTTIFLESAPSRFKLSFGINKNVVLKSVSNDIRRDKNGVMINKNCYMTFSALDVENNNKSLAESTFSYFNIDKPEWAMGNFIHQYNQLTEIMKAVVPRDNLTEVGAKLGKVLAEDQELFTKIAQTKTPSAALTKEVRGLQNKLVDAFIDAMKPYIGTEAELLNVIVVTNSKGQFFDLPREDKGFIAKVKGGRKLNVDSKYLRWYANKDKKETDAGDDIGDDEAIAEDEIIIDDDQELDDI